MAASGKSIIELTPASASFVARRVDTLGPWVLGAFTDCILMGVVFCQVYTFFTTKTPIKTGFQRYCYWLVLVVLFLSMLKTVQEMSVVWVQNVHDFANPDVARLRVVQAWWQVSTPLMTGVIGCVVQIHLVGVFVADFLITTGTFLALRRRASGLERTALLINRLVRMVFESAIPPTIIASIDLILTQTLGRKLLWHLLLNFALGKIYVISLLYTLNSINEYRREHNTHSYDIYSADGHGVHGHSRRNDLELGSIGTKPDQIYIQTQVSVSTHVSPLSGKGRAIEIHALNKQQSGTAGDDFKPDYR
ncbi:hypothetical protein DFH09DRAFT_1302400 [Mycena vulgaris]|nr:hypothetical protein DFH09DRAFT_1302400 [Mycena vulgaris]